MDAALPPTLSSQDLVSQSDNASANVGAGLSTPAPIPAPSQQTGVAPNTVQNSGDPVATPVKRKPGRPKGSVKKLTPGGEALGPANKIKRPVGRPRKDGLPAGSVTSGVRSRPRKSAPERLGGSNAKPANMSSQLTSAAFGVPQPGPTFRPYYPPNQMPGQAHYQTTFSASVGMQPSVSAPPIVAISNSNGSGPVVNSQLAYHIDPALDRDDWANLARTNHCALLQALLIALAAPNPVSTVGPSVEEAFKSHLISLAPNAAQKDSQPIPALYSILKTFWLPSSPAYFSLTASASTARTPSEHRFLYWDPQPLVFNGIACPVCSTPLINRGRIRSGPMKVYDLEKPFFIVGCEYVCKSPVCVANVSAEGRKFASTDQSILRSLPSRLRDEFPAHLMQGSGDLGSGANFWNWQATGVSGSLWNMVKGCLKCGMPRDAILTLINAIQHGTPDEQGAGEEEEEGEEGEEEDQLDQDQSMPQAAAQSAASALTTDGKKDGALDASDAYNNAWKAHSAIMEPNPNPESDNAQAGPSMPAGPTTMTTPMSSHTTPQPYGYPPGGPYMAYPYQPYPHYTVQQHQQSEGQSSTNPQPQPPPQSGTPEQNSLKRPFGYGDSNSEVSILEPSQKRTRHCCKCGSQECKGKGGRSFCLNACQDCGKLECKGRNSRRPDKRCAEAWA